jgi:hypothetical protein
MFKTLFTIGIALLAITATSAQNSKSFFKVPLSATTEMPLWAQEMYAADPDVFRVDELYRAYYQSNTFVKNIHTQNYKHWRRSIDQLLNRDGFIRPVSVEERTAFLNQLGEERRRETNQSRNFSSWTCLGPFETYSAGTGAVRSTQVNIYSFSQSLVNPDILFAGTESGGVYKSTDRGQNWTYVTASLPVNTITAIQTDPVNADIVYFSGNNRIYKTIDGGQNWTEIFLANASMYEFLIDPTDNQKIFAVGENGLLKSSNGGTSWAYQFSAECWDIDFKPGSTDTIYLLKNNSSNKIDEFFRSDDGGLTWNLKNNGYYTPQNFTQASAFGGKIAIM